MRALRSRKLSLQDYHFLPAAKDLTTFLSYLATTSYSSCLPATQPSAPLHSPHSGLSPEEIINYIPCRWARRSPFPA